MTDTIINLLPRPEGAVQIQFAREAGLRGAPRRGGGREERRGATARLRGPAPRGGRTGTPAGPLGSQSRHARGAGTLTSLNCEAIHMGPREGNKISSFVELSGRMPMRVNKT